MDIFFISSLLCKGIFVRYYLSYFTWMANMKQYEFDVCMWWDLASVFLHKVGFFTHLVSKASNRIILSHGLFQKKKLGKNSAIQKKNVSTNGLFFFSSLIRFLLGLLYLDIFQKKIIDFCLFRQKAQFPYFIQQCHI